MSSDSVKILLVDDQQENLLALEALLGDLGQTVHALSGREALKHLLDDEFAIIIMDVNMPGLSGFETAELVRQREGTKLVPIIFLTAMYTQDAHESQGYSLGAVDFITKPFVPEVLKTKVSVFVELFRKNRELREQAELIAAIESRRAQEAKERLDTQSQLMQEELLRKEAEHALLIERGLQLQKSEQLKSEFLANMSHEIRTPMHAIVGFADLLQRSQLDQEQKEFANLIGSAAQSLLTLINDILDLSKVEAGKLNLEEVDFDIRTLIDGTVTLVSETVRSKNLNLITYVDSDLPSLLKGDPGRLRQILLNLMSNAVKFTDSGEIVVRCQRVEEENIPGHISVLFSVSDTGIGITPSQIPHLFKPFSQADGSSTRKFGGTGLGLSISRRLVELMAGDICVESELSKGSKFWFKLNLEVSSTSNVIPIHRDGNRPRVLVLDGHPSARHIMQTYISSWNMECDVAVNGTEGLEMMNKSLANHCPYDIVITDLLLPGIDGLKLKEEMAQIPGLSGTKTILVTGYDMQDQGQAALKAGFCTHLTKPLEQSRLYNAISHVLTQDIVSVNEPEAHLPNRIDSLTDTLILLAEDNPVNQKVATLQLKQLGLKCVAVPNGKEALEEFKSGKYSLIIMDCQMPEMDGFQATQSIREAEKESHTHIPIIGLTAYAMEGDRDRCLNAGMDDYLSKPSTFEKLATILKQWLPHLAHLITEKQKTLPRAVAS